MSQAYSSALDLSFDVRAGLVMRQMHHWAALLFLAAIVVHLMRIFFTGAFRRPRELNWIIGITLLILAIFNGFAGYSLLDDQLSGTGLRIAYSITLSIPLIGTWLASLLFGGEFPGPDIINRLYVIHILLLPAAIIGLLVRAPRAWWCATSTPSSGVAVAPRRTSWASRCGPASPSSPSASCSASAAMTAALGGLAQINPVWLYGPYKVSNVSSASQPDWYMAWLDGALRVFPGWETRFLGFEIPGVFYAGVVLAAITFALLYLWPFLEATLHLRPRRAPPARPAPQPSGAHLHGGGHPHLLRPAHPVGLHRRAGHHLRPVGQRGGRQRPGRAHRAPADHGPRQLPAVPRAPGPRRGGGRGPARAAPIRWELLKVWEWPGRRKEAKAAMAREASGSGASTAVD